jgi:cysteine synthase A
VVTVATDGAEMYETERARIAARDYPGGFDTAAAAETFGRWMLSAGTNDLLETTQQDRARIFNLGYYTWVEQQGTPFDLFTARRDQSWWKAMWPIVAQWDAAITEFNARVAHR